MWFRSLFPKIFGFGAGALLLLAFEASLFGSELREQKAQPKRIYPKPSQSTGWCQGALMTLSFPAIQRVQNWMSLPKPENLDFQKIGVLFFPVHPDGESTTSVQFVLRDPESEKMWIYKVRNRIKRLKELDQRIRVSEKHPKYRFYYFQLGVSDSEYKKILNLFGKTNVFTGPTCASGLCRSLGTALPDLFFLHRFPESIKQKIPALKKSLSTFDNIPSIMYLPPAVTAAYLMILQKTLHPRLGDIYYYGPEDHGLKSKELWKELALISTAPVSVPLWWFYKFKLNKKLSLEPTKDSENL